MGVLSIIAKQPRAFKYTLGVILATDAMWGMVLMFALPASVIPAYLTLCGSAKSIIGPAASLIVLTTPIQLLTGMIIFGPKRKHQCCYVYMLSGLMLFLFGLIALFLPLDAQAIRVIGFLIGMMLFLLLVNLASPAFYAMIADNCPVKLRGRLFTLRAICIALGAAVAAAPAQWIHNTFEALRSFDVALLVSGLLVVAYGAILLGFPDERAYAASKSAARSRQQKGVRVQLLRLWHDSDYRIALLFMACLLMGLLLTPFILTYAMDQVFVQASEAYSRMNNAYLLGYVVAGLTLGPLADRYGYKASAMVTALVGMIAFGLAWSGQGTYAMYAAYLFTGVLAISLPTIFFNFGIELVPRVSRMVIAAAPGVFCVGLQLLLPLAAGFMIDHYMQRDLAFTGYVAVFCAGTVLCGLALAGFAMLVNEPRTGRRFVIKTIARVGV